MEKKRISCYCIQIQIYAVELIFIDLTLTFKFLKLSASLTSNFYLLLDQQFIPNVGGGAIASIPLLELYHFLSVFNRILSCKPDINKSERLCVMALKFVSAIFVKPLPQSIVGENHPSYSEQYFESSHNSKISFSHNYFQISLYHLSIHNNKKMIQIKLPLRSINHHQLWSCNSLGWLRSSRVLQA